MTFVTNSMANYVEPFSQEAGNNEIQIFGTVK